MANVEFIEAREALSKRLALVVENFSTLYPGFQPPKFFDGFPASEPPFYIAVDSLIDTANTSGRATTGGGQLDFTLRVLCFARHSDQTTSANTLLAYIHAVFQSVMADQRLNMTVDNSFPRIEAAGTSADSSKYYMSAATVAIDCSVFSQCSRIKEIINASN